MAKYIKGLRLKASDFVASCVATWTFVFLYTGTMLAWIAMHKFGILNIDSPEFMCYNLLLSWFAGTQASVILITTNRKADIDSKNIAKGVQLDLEGIALDKEVMLCVNKVLSKVENINNKAKMLEDIIELAEKEENKHVSKSMSQGQSKVS